MMLFGAIEAGGTKFVCAVGNADLEIIDKITIPTTTPDETMEEVVSFFKQYNILSIGVGSFGPIDVNLKSNTYGFITSTPKENWGNFNFIGKLKEFKDIPIGWTTDVNAAALGEYHKGIAKKSESCIYLTVGTGIGGGAIVNGEILKGYGHPEMGHILIRQHSRDSFSGICPYHKNCLEGVASGPAIEKRYGKKAIELESIKEVWEIESYYLAQALVAYTLVLSPEKIILGGGVMNQAQLLPLIQEKFENMMANYIITPPKEDYIVKPKLKNDAGIIGGLILAEKVLSIN